MLIALFVVLVLYAVVSITLLWYIKDTVECKDELRTIRDVLHDRLPERKIRKDWTIGSAMKEPIHRMKGPSLKRRRSKRSSKRRA